ncbi:MFS transporter [Nocardia sp. R6R-6]|uniref:MFS transporter n=1 Tax=Nocardia sp. R6R-6 TaxID=3459303 RepID=UPI00403D7D57
MVRAVLFKSTGELIPLYALYALLFADHGMSAGQISALFAIWSATSFLLEVPSGAWADTVSRRGLLVLSGALLTAGFALWTVAPSFPGFAAGFVLWGTSGALASGTFEALLYDDLAARGKAASYPGILGYTRAGAEAAVVVAIVAATPLYLYGGYALVGWSSVAVAAVHTVVALSLPTAPKAVSAADVDDLEDALPESSEDDSAVRSGATHTPARRTDPGNPALRVDTASAANDCAAESAVEADAVVGASVQAADGVGARATVPGAVGRSDPGDCAVPNIAPVPNIAALGCASNADARGAAGGAVPGGYSAATDGGSVDAGNRAGSDPQVTHSVSGERGVLPGGSTQRPRPFVQYLGMLKAGVVEAVRVRACAMACCWKRCCSASRRSTNTSVCSRSKSAFPPRWCRCWSVSPCWVR